MTDEDARAIWGAILACNRAWREGRPRDVAALFFEDVVAEFPNVRLEGREAVVKSYVDYSENVITHDFEELDHTADVFQDTAVVRYRFSVEYEAEGEIHDELGEEILVFVRREGRWGVVWRTQRVAAT